MTLAGPASAPHSASLDPGLTPPSSLTALFLGFLEVALCSFGGAFAWAHRILVLRRRWLDEEDFAQALSLCQVLPGPNIVNLSIFLGDRFFGIRGAIVAALGLTAVPICIVVLLEVLYLKYSHIGAVVSMLGHMGAAAAGLVLGLGLRLLWRLQRRWACYLIAGLAFVAIGVLRWPLPPVMLALVPLSLLFAWWRKI